MKFVLYCVNIPSMQRLVFDFGFHKKFFLLQHNNLHFVFFSFYMMPSSNECESNLGSKSGLTCSVLAFTGMLTIKDVNFRKF